MRLVEVMVEGTMEKVYLVSELFPRGEVFHYIEMNQTFNPPETRLIFMHILSALEYIIRVVAKFALNRVNKLTQLKHSERWCHRDIKRESSSCSTILPRYSRAHLAMTLLGSSSLAPILLDLAGGHS